MANIPLPEAQRWAGRAQALAGAPRAYVASRKVALTTSAVKVQLPVHNGNKPTFIRFGIPSGGVAYLNMAAPAVVPTTSVDGGELIFDGDVIVPWGEESMWLIAESSITAVISYVWTQEA